MAWSRLQSAVLASPGTAVTSAAKAFTTANLSSGTTVIAVVSISSVTVSGITGVSASCGGTAMVLIKTVTSGSAGSEDIVAIYALNTPAGQVGTKPTVTVSWTNNGNGSLIIQEISGLATGATLATLADGTPGGNTGSGVGSATQGAYSSTAANEYLVAIYGDDGGTSAYTTPSGYTADANNVGGANGSANIGISYKNSTNGSETGTYTLAGAPGQWGTILVAFKLAATGTSVSGVTATATATATAGTLAAGATVAGAVGTAAAAAPAGTLSAGAVVSGAVATAAAAAPAGAPLISVTIPGVLATAAAAAPAGTLSAGAVVAGVTATATAVAPAGSIPGVAAPTFPAAPLGATVELLLNGTWTSVTPYVSYSKQPPQITRGHPDEGVTAAPATLALALDNRTFNFTSANPLGSFYPYLGRNVQLRMSIPEGASYLRLEGDQVSYASCPDSAGVSITGDMDVQLDVTLDNWNAGTTLAGKWAQTGNERSWLLMCEPNGTLLFVWTTAGTGGGGITVAPSTRTVPLPPLRRMCVRVTLAVATGTVTFYTAPPGLSSPTWTQLGSALVSGATSVFDSTSPLQAGYCTDSEYTGFGWAAINGKIHAFKLLAGIGGTVKASPDFTVQTPGATSFADVQGNTWTLAGTSEISNRKYRCHMETSAWTPSSDPTTKDVWMNITAGGILRRIQQGTEALGSAFRRALPSATGLAGYWPCEDGNTTAAGATPASPTQFASAVMGNLAGTFTGGLPGFASDNSFLCSQSLPTINGARWHFTLPTRGADTANVMRFLMHVPAGGDTVNGVIARMFTVGTVAQVDLVYASGGGLTLNGYDQSGASLFTTGVFGFAVNGELLWVSVELQQSGGNVAYSAVTLQPGATTGLAVTGNVAGTIGNASQLIINGISTANLSGTSIGHVTYQSQWQSLFNFALQLNAYQGESAGTRIKRLCAEQGIPFRAVGSLADTVLMGAQTPLSLSALLQECADADRGQIFEPRQCFALAYRTRASLQNQAAGATLNYSADGLAQFIQSTEDDQYTANDVVVTRAYASGGGAGSSAEAILTSGPLSVQPPPNGVGPYPPNSVTCNLYTDGQLADEAGWLLWLGTVNEPRYPSIEYDLARHDIGSLLYSLPDLDLGDRLVVGSTAGWLPPDGITQLVTECTETFPSEVNYRIAWCCVPERPYQTAIFDDLVYGRYDTDGSVLHAGITSAATSIQVDTSTAGSPAWTTSGGDFPFDIRIGGERMTVTNITGAASPQTFTVTRSVNGVVKAHLAGDDVRLFFPPVYSL